MNKFLTFPFEFKAVEEDDDGQGVIEGYASTFGNMDLGFDIVDKGAFRKTLRETKGRVPILADHMPSQQIGWNERAEEDEKGLFVRGRLDIVNNAKARERYSLAKQGMKLGAKVGLSIGYMTVKAEPDDANRSVRRLKELKLFEYSLVTFPMNTEAMITAAKQWAEGKPDLEQAAALFIVEMQKSGYLPDQVIQALEKHRAAKGKEDPGHVLQSLRDGVARIQKTLAA